MFMAKILKKTKEAADDVMKWAAAEYNYLKEFKEDLENLKTHLNDLKSEKKTLGKAKAALRQIGRSERRVNRYYQRLNKDIKSLAGMLPENLRQEEVDIEKQIEIAAKSILEKGSRYVGSLKSQLNSLITEFDLLKKFKNKPEEKSIDQKISAIADNLIKELEGMVNWIGGLVAAVKSEESFDMKLAA